MTIFPVIFVCLFAAAYGHGNYPHKPPVDYKPPVYDYKPAPYAYKPYKPYDYKPAMPAKPKLVPIPFPLPFPAVSKPVKVAVQVSNIQEAGKGGKGGNKGGLLGGLKKIASPLKKFKKQQGFVGNLLEVPNPRPVVIHKPVPKPILVPFVFPPTRHEYSPSYGGYGEPKSEAAAAASELGSFTDFMKPLLSSL